MVAAPKPQAVLFACGLNSVRSPMAAGLFKQIMGGGSYVSSAGVRKDELDPFAVAVLEEVGIDISRHRPMTFDELEDWEGLNFDLIITLAPEADPRPDRDGRHARAAAHGIPGGARSTDRAHQESFRLAARRQ